MKGMGILAIHLCPGIIGEVVCYKCVTDLSWKWLRSRGVLVVTGLLRILASILFMWEGSFVSRLPVPARLVVPLTSSCKISQASNMFPVKYLYLL